VSLAAWNSHCGAGNLARRRLSGGALIAGQKPGGSLERLPHNDTYSGRGILVAAAFQAAH
jgi:hypothetical protein